jgi:hypothetical protein
VQSWNGHRRLSTIPKECPKLQDLLGSANPPAVEQRQQTLALSLWNLIQFRNYQLGLHSLLLCVYFVQNAI